MIIAIGCGGLGFLGGVFSTKAARDFFTDLSKVEGPAEVKNPRKLKTDFYELSYPRNWRLDEDDPDFDLENYFMIESLDSCFVSVSFNHFEEDLDESLQYHVEEYEDMMRNPKITEFTKYGSLEGKGKRIEGKAYGIGMVVDVFTAVQNGMTLSVVEWLYVEDAKDVLPGFELIESSFKLMEEASIEAPSKEEE